MIKRLKQIIYSSYGGKNMDFVEMGKRIKLKRLELKLTQERLAELLNLSPTYIGAIERATSKCSLETIVTIAKTLDLDMNYLLFGITFKNVDSVFSQILAKLPENKKDLYIRLCESIAQTLLK